MGGRFSLPLAHYLRTPSVNRKQAGEIYQKLLTIRKLVHIDKVHAAHYIHPCNLVLCLEEEILYINCYITLEEHIEELKTRRDFHLGLQ